VRRHLYYYTHVDLPFGEAADRVSADPSAWLPPPATPVDGAWEVFLNAEGTLPASMAERPVRVTLGQVSRHDFGLLIPISWRAVTADRLFPVLSADLELVPLSGWASQLSLMGTYRPPLSVVGDAGDRLVGHRVAEACVRRFVLDVADRVGAATLQA
jgi:hypothetical protein